MPALGRLKRAAMLVPGIGALLRRRERRMTAYHAPPGHFYSPIPSLAEVAGDAARIFAAPRHLPGIAIDDEAQLRLLAELAPAHADMPFADQPVEGLRYHFDNANFRHGDGIALHAMIRRFRPRRIVEVGSGFSSCVILDTLERFPSGAVECTFIEPHAQLVRRLTSAGPAGGPAFRIIERRVQDAPPEVFAALAAGDILFIDSSHVSKIGSDVNHLLFEVLPTLAEGVLVHLHDIFWPFEYPRSWIEEGRAWNEAYLVRAFLQHNRTFEVLLFNDHLARFHREALGRAWPRALADTGGSLWLRRKAGG